MQAVAGQVVHLVDVDRPGEHAGQEARFRIARFSRQQGHQVPGLNGPIVAQRVGDFAFQQKAVGEQLVLRHAGQPHVFDRVAKRPMAQVVQQRGDDKQLGVRRRNDRGKALVVGKLPQEQQGQAIHAQRMLEPRVDGRRIDQRHQAQLADPGQAAKLAAVDDGPHAGRERHVEFRRNAHVLRRRGGHGPQRRQAQRGTQQ